MLSCQRPLKPGPGYVVEMQPRFGQIPRPARPNDVRRPRPVARQVPSPESDEPDETDETESPDESRTPTSLTGKLRDAFEQISSISVRRTGDEDGAVRPPVMQAEASAEFLAKWVEFETSRAPSDVYVYVDAENVLKTLTSTLNVQWPARATCSDLIAVADAICGHWIRKAPEASAHGEPSVSWMVYSKRPFYDDCGNSFAVSRSGDGVRDGDETDDILCVAAACARVRSGDGRVCLVSGDEMRWTGLDDAISSSWESIDRGPRHAPRDGNRLVPHILETLRRCGGDANDFLRCVRYGTPDDETDEAPLNGERADVFDPAILDAADGALARHASAPHQPPNSVVGQTVVASFVLFASMITLIIGKNIV